MNKVYKNRRYIPWIFHSIYLNYRCLPIRQAYKLPIWVINPHFDSLKGKIIINNENIRCGMIKLGDKNLCHYRKLGITIENNGHIIFNGPCKIDGGSTISTGLDGKLFFGNNIHINMNTFIACFSKIELGNNLRCSWNTQILDTDYHSLKNTITGHKLKACSPIHIGENNWIGNNYIIAKGTKTPCYTTIGQGSVVKGAYKCKEKSIISGNPAKVVLEGLYYLDSEDMNIVK